MLCSHRAAFAKRAVSYGEHGSSTRVGLSQTFLAVFARVSDPAEAVVVPSLVAPAEAAVATRLQNARVLHLGATDTSG